MKEFAQTADILVPSACGRGARSCSRTRRLGRRLANSLIDGGDSLSNRRANWVLFAQDFVAHESIELLAVFGTYEL